MGREDIFKFYNSKEWRACAKRIKTERALQDGLKCERCGEKIKDSRKCIAHHKQHLNQYNINDANITFNDANIEIICFKCHNEEHGRYTNKKLKKNVYIVYGAPLSGKNSLVNQVSSFGDIVLDMDKLFEAISNQELYDKPNNLRFNVFKIRDCILDQIKTRYGEWHNAYVVGGYADKYKREKLADELGAELIFCEATKEECIARLEIENKRDKKEWIKYIDKWFEEYS